MEVFGQITMTIAAAFLGAWLTLQRFRIERWWDKKANAYIELVESLHDMGLPPSEYFNAGAEGRDLPREREEELWAAFKEAEKKVWKIADSADFIISSEVFDSIQRMRRGLTDAGDAQDWYQHLQETEEAINACLREVKAIGAEELGIKKGKNWERWFSVTFLGTRFKERLGRSD